MRKTALHSLVAAVALIGAGAAQASIIAPSAAGGSEALLTLVNTGNNATITQDLGVQIGQVTSGSVYALSAALQSFIGTAGGLANVTYAIIAGESGTRTYLTSTTDASLKSVDIANSERNVWSNTVTGMVNQLNSGDASATTANNSYGPYATGAAGNYVDAGWDLWNGAYVVNTGPGDGDLILYKVVYGTSNLANATITHLFGDDPLDPEAVGNSFARLGGTSLQIGAAVPAPGALWLLGTGLAGLAGRRLRRRT